MISGHELEFVVRGEPVRCEATRDVYRMESSGKHFDVDGVETQVVILKKLPSGSIPVVVNLSRFLTSFHLA